MPKRHRNALMMQEGACNPSGIAHTLVAACKECLDEGQSQKTDPAVRLIVHQLAYICGITTGAEGMATAPSWEDCMTACHDYVEKETG